jgi:hypothetical protein
MMPENKFAINAPHSQEIMQRWGSVNLQKFILTGPAEIAVKLLETMMNGFDMRDVKPEEHDSAFRLIPHVACEVAQHFWNDCEQRGWLLSQDQGSAPEAPALITGTSHVDISDIEHPVTLSHEEWMVQQGRIVDEQQRAEKASDDLRG